MSFLTSWKYKLKGRGYHVLPKEKIDPRDWLYGAVKVATPNPTLVDKRAECQTVDDQKNCEGCTGYSTASVKDVDFKQYNGFKVSAKYIYWKARLAQGWTAHDGGAYIFDAVKAASIGTAPELLHPTTISVFKAPSKMADSFAMFFDFKKNDYYKITDANMDNSFVDDVKNALANGYHVVGGITLPEEFFNPFAGIVLCNPQSKLSGGHALHWCGYVEVSEEIYNKVMNKELGFEGVLVNKSDVPSKYSFLMYKNSWGTGYGQSGYGLISTDWVDEHGNDFWAVKPNSTTHQ